MRIHKMCETVQAGILAGFFGRTLREKFNRAHRLLIEQATGG
jgi:hypothetical protein